MKTFIALTFIGILTSAYSQSVQKCTTPTPVMDNFKAPNFHNGTWYVTHVKYVTIPTECRTLTTWQEDDKSYVEHEFTKNGLKGNLRCEAQAKTAKRLSFTCTFNGERIDKTIFIVMASDYNDYALYYLCSTITGANADRKAGDTVENYLVARRTPGNTEIPKQLESLTRGMNLQKCS
uniref:Salivary lipocalin n=1 Tax=Triatoma dimidiata TaxID=72491 RepID=D1MWB1_TRIDM|nr:hypothetical protein Td05 similar to procalin precursor protein [Triatoma dimidiata]